MIILAIDTTTQVCSVAVSDNETIIIEYTQNIKKTHSQRLLPLIDCALKGAGFQPDNVDAVAVAAGPGSFTGVRIGVSTARAFAQAMKIPAVGVCTLEALAQNIITATPSLVCPILDARRNEVYTAVYQGSSGNATTETILSPSAIPLQQLIDIIAPRNETAYFPGDGLLKFTPRLREVLGNRFGHLPPYMALNRASAVAALAVRELEANNYLSELLPMYIRRPEAERLDIEKREGKN